jgi:hypothetical protein
MVFGDLRVGDHFVWAFPGQQPIPDSINVNVKIAWSEDGGGFAIDLYTRQDTLEQAGSGANDPKEWISKDARVIKLNGTL